MQELVREYLNELGKKQKKHRRFRIVTAVFAVMVVAGVCQEPESLRRENQSVERKSISIRTNVTATL